MHHFLMTAFVVLFTVGLIRGQNNALDFDGVNDYVSIADNGQIEFGPADNFSIEVWVKIPSANQNVPNSTVYNSIVEKTSITGPYPYAIRYHNHLSADNGKIQVVRYDGTNTSSVMSTTVVNDNAWHHIAFVKNGNDLQLFIDGVLQVTGMDLSAGATTNSAALLLGRHGNAVISNPWKGTMDQLRIWNDSRTAQEVAENMTKEMTGNESNLMALYHFNYGIPGGSNTGQTTLDDATANSNNGTLNNFSLTGISSNFVSSNGTTEEGNVGVGTDQPNATLHVKGNSWTSLTIEAAGNDPQIQLTDDGSDVNNDWTIRMDDSNADALQIRNNLVDVMMMSAAGSVGIGTVLPVSKLDVFQDASGSAINGTTTHISGTGVLGSATSTTGTTYGVRGNVDSGSGYGVYGYCSFPTSGRGVYGGGHIGVQGETSSAGGRALYGLANSATGLTYGVYAQSSSTLGRGIYGVATSTTGATIGIHGRAASTTGYGIFGEATSLTGINRGIYGRTESSEGAGVFGESAALTGSPVGVYGKTVSSTGIAVYGESSATTGATYGVYGKTSSNIGRGVFGEATATGNSSYGVYGLANGSGAGVFGENLATSGTSYGIMGEINSTSGASVQGKVSSNSGYAAGVRGETDSGDGYGVFGINHASGVGIRGEAGSGINFDGIGVLGISYNYGQIGTGSFGVKGITSGYYDNAAGVYGVAEHDGISIAYGVLGTAASTAGIGIKGIATAATGTTYGVYGQVSSNAGRGVYGLADAETGTTYGVSGTSNSTSGRGVRGLADAATGTTYGVVGISESSTGIGVYGEASGSSAKALYGVAAGTNGKGIHAVASGTGSSANAILAQATGGFPAYAGWFTGRVHVDGNLSKATGSFKIDHPLDPENKYLYHSFVESPDMMNIYNGNVTTDGSGHAEIILPDYFEALNMEFRYQLTVIGEFAQAIISKEIHGNRFSIRTDKPNIKVSWQVTGIRQDPYAKAHRIVPEVAKEPENIGKYLTPAVYGQPAESAINYTEPPVPERENR